MSAYADLEDDTVSKRGLIARVRDLEARLEESEETVAAIRRGDFDAVVVEGPNSERYVYTLENADRPYRVLIEQIQEGALTLGADGTVLYCNRRLAEMLGQPQERVTGQNLRAFMLREDGPAFAGLLEQGATGPARAELTLIAVGMPPRPAYVSLSPLPREDSAPLLCGVLTDLTEQRAHLRDLAEANDRLRSEAAEREKIEDALRQAQKMEAVGQLTGGIAHDFNNLLTIIRSSTDLLRRPDLAEERRRRYVDAIADTVDRAAKLTGQLLAFARRQALKPEVFDVGERMRLTADMLQTIVGSRIQIARHVPRDPCFVRADASQFETALVNLAVNARDAMDGEGMLTLRIACDAPDAPPSSPDGGEGPFVAVSLADTGIGIPEDRLARVFEPFYTTKEVGKGTGLGLSQVFGFAKQSGGTVDVASTVGQGTTFTLYLPQVAGDALAPAKAARGPSQRDTGGGRRVLVVEDNVDVGTFSTQLLQDLGYETTWAASADEALTLLREDGARFDVVFSDVVMPGMNGVDLGRAIKSGWPGLPVVLTSGYSHVLAEDADHGFDVLRKPYAVEELSRVLRKVPSKPR